MTDIDLGKGLESRFGIQTLTCERVMFVVVQLKSFVLVYLGWSFERALCHDIVLNAIYNFPLNKEFQYLILIPKVFQQTICFSAILSGKPKFLPHNIPPFLLVSRMSGHMHAQSIHDTCQFESWPPFFEIIILFIIFVVVVVNWCYVTDDDDSYFSWECCFFGMMIILCCLLRRTGSIVYAFSIIYCGVVSCDWYYNSPPLVHGHALLTRQCMCVCGGGRGWMG